MPPRSSWKGFLRVSLVSLPVKGYSASSSNGASIRLNQLHAQCHCRIKQPRVCPLHGELGSDQIVSGYEHAKDQYVIVDPQELDKLRTANDKAITVDKFVAAEVIDPIYHAGKTYYLVPDGPVGQKPYRLLYQTMISRKLHAVARVVLARKEQLVLVRPVGPAAGDDRRSVTSTRSRSLAPLRTS